MLKSTARLFRPQLLRTTRSRLVFLVILILLPALGVQVYGAWSDLHRTLEERRQNTVRAAEQARNEFFGLLSETRSMFIDLVRVPQMRVPGNCPQVFASLRFAFARLTPNISNLTLADADGKIYCAVNPVMGTMSIGDRPDFLSAVDSLELSPGRYYLDPTSRVPLLNASYPILSFDGNLETVISVDLSTGWLDAWQVKASLPPGTALTLLSDDSQVVWRSVDGRHLAAGELPQAPSGWLAGFQTPGIPIEGPDLDGVTRLNIFLPLREGRQTAAYLHLGYPVREVYDQAYANLYWKLGLLALVLAAAILVAWWGSASLFLHPLSHLMGAVRRVQEGDLSARAPVLGGLSELSMLGGAFNAMADSLERREADRQRMEGQFTAAFESSAIGMGLMTVDGTILAANAAVCEMSGYSEEELRSRRDSLNVYPPDAQVGMDLFAEMLEGKRNSYSIERRYIRKSGQVFWVRLTLSLVRDAQGTPVYLVGQIEDIDEQKRKSAALVESEARFRAMFVNSAVGIGLLSLERVVLDANPAMCAMLGYAHEEIIGVTPQIVTHPEDYPESTAQFRRLMEGEISHYISERRFVRKDGASFWAQISMSLVRDSQSKPLYLVGMIIDIDSQKRAAEQLAEQENEYRSLLEQRVAERTAELNQANERLREKAAQDAVTAERTRLARDLHDAVTQTLFSTTLIADVLPDIWAMNPDEGKRRLEEVRQLTRGALAEMRTLLVELRPNALIEVPLPVLLRQLTEALIGRSRMNIQLNILGERRFPPDVQVGLYRLAQEALNNAVKHANASQAVVTLHCGDAVRLTVEDNGRGFDPATVTADHLGLKIMRERAEAIDARLSIYSEPGEGTQISVVWEPPRDS